MAIEGLSPAPAHARAEVSGGTEQQLHALLVGYASALEATDNAPYVLWANIEKPRILRWLRFPAPRPLVSTLLVRHVSRCVSALKRGVGRQVALADDAPESLRDLKMLEQFEQSLPTGVRIAAIAPLALLAILFVAYILNFLFKAGYSTLLGGFMTVALLRDTGAALSVFENDNVGLGGSEAIPMIVAFSATLVIAPLLPAFSVKRRLLRPLAGLETRGFAALGCRRVQDLELDLVTQLFLITPVLVIGVWTLWLGALAPSSVRAVYGAGDVAAGAVPVSLAALAGVEVCRRYAVRRMDTMRPHASIKRIALWITRVALWLASGLAIALFISMIFTH
jgi:hypothetical protein